MLKTEERNPHSRNIDKMTSLEMVQLMNRENMNSVLAVEAALPQIAKAVDAVADAMKAGGRLIYIGAGTSGRLGVIDASECPPTFGVSYDTVQGIIAGGQERMFRAGENAEDYFECGVQDVTAVLQPGDVLVGISAAGGAKYVLGAMDAAKKMGCTTIAISSNDGVPIILAADIPIVCDTGAEVITGSTRLKAGNSQKFVLNMLSTCAMIHTGKVYENLMINLKPSNEKLKSRVVRITKEIIDCTEQEAEAKLEKNGWDIRKTVESEGK